MKKLSKTEELVEKLAKPIAESHGFTLWDVRFEKEGSMWILLIVLDKEGGITIDDCEVVSRELDTKLDEVDPIDKSYCLEVSSAGIERELHRDWHFDAMQGEKIVVRLIRPQEGIKEFVGELLAHHDGEVTALIDGSEKTFSEGDIAFVKLYVEF